MTALAFAIGLACAIGMSFIAVQLLVGSEWREKKAIADKVDRMYEYLCCRQGFFGCDEQDCQLSRNHEKHDVKKSWL